LSIKDIDRYQQAINTPVDKFWYCYFYYYVSFKHFYYTRRIPILQEKKENFFMQENRFARHAELLRDFQWLEFF